MTNLSQGQASFGFDDRCVALDPEFADQIRLAEYLIQFDDEERPYPSVLPHCEMEDGDSSVGLPPGCEYCFHLQLHLIRQWLKDEDFAVLQKIHSAPKHVYQGKKGLNEESLFRLQMAGYVFHQPRPDQYILSGHGRGALSEWNEQHG